MRTITALAALVLVAACTKESSAPAATVQKAAPVEVEAAPGAKAEAVQGEKLAFDESHGKVAWVASKVTLTHFGGFAEFEGNITLVDGQAAGSAVEVVIKTASIFSDDPKLTNHLKTEDFFDVANIPEASFRSSEIKATEDGYVVTGDFSLHGVTKSISFPAKIDVSDARFAVDSTFTINRKDFGMVYPGMPDNLIRDNVEINLVLEVPRAPATAAVGE